MRKSLLSKLLAALAVLAPYVTAQSNGSVSGEVADATGAVIAVASVELQSPQLSRKSKTSGIGRFEFTDVPPGQYGVVVSSDGFATKLVRIGVAPGEDRALNTIQLEVLGLDIYEPPVVRILDPPSLTGNMVLRIYDFGYQVMSGASVTLLCRGSSKSCGTRSANREGMVRFEGLEEGSYRVSLAVKGFYEDSYTLFVSSGVEHELRVFVEKCVESTCDPGRRPVKIRLE